MDLGASAEAAMERLRQAQVHVEGRATGIRVSPHIYNTLDDIDTFVRVATA